MNIKMIVTDLDRTLLQSDKTISDYTAKALARCREKGIKVVFATARPLRLIQDYLAKIPVDAVIANNGATVVIDNETVCEHNIATDVKDAILHDLAFEPAITRMSAESGNHLLSGYEPPKMLVNSNRWNAIRTDFTKTVTAPLCKISVHCDTPKIPLSIVAKYPSLHVYSVTGEDLYSILDEHSSKSNGIKDISKRFGISNAEIAAFGDDYNDIEMLQSCGIGVAVENALNEAKAAADYICGSNDEDGVAKWIEGNLT